MQDDLILHPELVLFFFTFMVIHITCRSESVKLSDSLIRQVQDSQVSRNANSPMAHAGIDKWKAKGEAHRTTNARDTDAEVDVVAPEDASNPVAEDTKKLNAVAEGPQKDEASNHEVSDGGRASCR